MDDKSKFNELEVDSKFRAVLVNLGRLSDELDAVCLRQAEEGYDRAAIEALLTRMDNFISKSPVVENARIEGSADVQKIVDLLNQEVARRLQIIKDNFREADIPDFEDIGKNFAENKTNTMQKELSEFDSASIESKDVATRQSDAAAKKLSLEKRIENAEKLKAIYDAHSGMDKDQLLESVDTAKTQYAAITMSTAEFKTPDEYRAILKSIKEDSRGVNAYSTKNSLEKLSKQIEVLETLKGDPEIDALLDVLKDALTKGSDGKLSFDSTKIKEIQKATKDVKNFKIEDKIEAAKTAVVNSNKTLLVDLINGNAVFDFYPEKKQEWLDLLKGERPDVDAIKADIAAVALTGEKVTEFEEYVEQADGDVAKLSDLKLEHRDARDAERNLRDLNSRHVTSATRELFGQRLEAKRNDGTVVDITTVVPENDAQIDRLYLDLMDKADQEEIDNAFEATPDLPDKVKKPSLLKRIFWKLTNPKTWGTGMGYVDYVKADWVKAQIRHEIKEIKDDAARTDGPAWTISPEKRAEIEEADRKRAEEAKRKERESIIKSGKKAKDAVASAKEDLDKKQTEADLDLDL